MLSSVPRHQTPCLCCHKVYLAIKLLVNISIYQMELVDVLVLLVLL